MRPRDEQKELRIMEAALDLIFSEGIAGLKMSALAKSAGMAAGTLYIYFESKEELLSRMYLHYNRQMTAEVRGKIGTDGEYKERIKQMWFNYLHFVSSYPRENVFLEQFYRSPFATLTILEQNNELLDPFRQLINEGQRAGMLTNGDPELILAHLCGAVQGVVSWTYDGSYTLDAEHKEQAWLLASKSLFN